MSMLKNSPQRPVSGILGPPPQARAPSLHRQNKIARQAGFENRQAMQQMPQRNLGPAPMQVPSRNTGPAPMPQNFAQNFPNAFQPPQYGSWMGSQMQPGMQFNGGSQGFNENTGMRQPMQQMPQGPQDMTYNGFNPYKNGAF